MQQKYLFILSPPYSGSTVLWRLLQTSAQVSALPDEGQKLPELREMMRRNPWDPTEEYDWALIKRTWQSYWSPEKAVLLEKSPPHLCRFETLGEHFQPANYILLLRDPLAISEALHRRNALPWDAAIKRWIEWLAMFLRCRQELPNSFLLYYEDMVQQPDSEFARLGRWLPELADVNPTAKVKAHAIDGMQHRGLTDMNPLKEQQIPDAAQAIVRKALCNDHAQEMLAQTPYAQRYANI